MLALIILASITFPIYAFCFTIWFQCIRRRTTRRLKRLNNIANVLALASIIAWDIFGFWPTISTKWQDGILFVGLTLFLIVLGITIWRVIHDW